MSIDTMLVMIALHQDPVFMPFAGRKLLHRELANHPRLPGLIYNHLLARMRENPSTLFLVEHAVVVRVIGNDIALIACHHIETSLRCRVAAVLKTAVAALADLNLHTQIKVPDRRSLPGNETIHLQ